MQKSPAQKNKIVAGKFFSIVLSCCLGISVSGGYVYAQSYNQGVYNGSGVYPGDPTSTLSSSSGSSGSSSGGSSSSGSSSGGSTSSSGSGSSSSGSTSGGSTSGSTSGGGSSTSGSGYTGQFSINDRIQTTDALNVRSTPSTAVSSLETKPAGSQGTLIGGPTFANSYWWWQINYDTGADGWSVENWLQKISSGGSSSGGSSSGGSSSGSGVGNATDVLYASCYHAYNRENVAPASYATPINYHGSRELLTKVNCNASTAYLIAGSNQNNQYVYNTGYAYHQGAWQPVNLSGSNTNGAWIAQLGTGRLPFAVNDFSTWQYVISYTCVWANSKWNCGCADQVCSQGKWHLQAVRK